MEDSSATEAIPSEILATYLRAMANAKRIHLLQFLAKPHHLEEIANELGVARQTAQEHVLQLYEAGLLIKTEGKGQTKTVTDYVVAPQRLFHVYEMMGLLSEVRPDVEETLEVRHVTEPSAAGAAGPRDPDLPRLTVMHGLRIGHTLTLTGNGPWLLGRDPEAAICLDYDPYASNRHAEIRRVPNGFVVADLYSRNGTHVEWHPLARGGSHKLENGQVVRIGKTILLFRKLA